MIQQWQPAQAEESGSWMRTLALLTLFALSIGLAQAVEADTPYWQLTTESVTVISNSGAKRCERLASQFLTFQRLLRDLAGLDDDVAFRPVTLYSLSDGDASQVFLSEADRRQQNAQRVRIYSKYLPGMDRDVAAIVDTGNGDDPLQSVLLLYARSVLMAGPTRGFPPWYVIGISDVTNGVLIRDDESVLLSRDGPFEPVVAKQVRTKYDLAALLSATYKDLSSGGDFKEFSKRAREWAQFGVLTTPERRTHYRELGVLMRQGTPAEDALNQAFGIPLADVAKDFEDGRWRHDAVFRIPPPKTLPTVPAGQPLDPGQIKAALQVLADRALQQPLNH